MGQKTYWMIMLLIISTSVEVNAQNTQSPVIKERQTAFSSTDSMQVKRVMTAFLFRQESHMNRHQTTSAGEIQSGYDQKPSAWELGLLSSIVQIFHEPSLSDQDWFVDLRSMPYYPTKSPYIEPYLTD